jgi:hypothetical protein
MLAGYRSDWRKRIIPLALIVAVAGTYLFVILHRRVPLGIDFQYHRQFGERFLLKQPLYEDNLCFNYMPVSAMVYSPLAMLPVGAAFVARYLASLVCLTLVLFWLWRLLPEDQRPKSRFLLIALPLVFTSRYILRDLDDGGPHLFYLAMLIGGLVCARRAWNCLGGCWFGLAIAVKMTPALLLPYLAWKRKWRLLTATVVAAALWIAAPALHLGIDLWWHYQQQWNQVALASVTGKDLGPVSEFMNYNDQRIQNQSLKLALTHLFVTYPEGDLRRPESGYWSLLDLDPALARWLVNLGMVCLLVVFWRKTRAATGRPDQGAMPLELSGLILLMLLFSPVTWLQHMVWAIPAMFFLLARELSAGGSWPARSLLVLVFVLTMGLNREILGSKINYTMLGCHVHTIGMLLLLGMVLWRIGITRKAGDTMRAQFPMRKAA